MFITRKDKYITGYASCEQYEGQEWIDDDSREFVDFMNNEGGYTEKEKMLRSDIEDYKVYCKSCCKDKLSEQYEKGIQYAYQDNVYWIKANENTQLQAGSKKVALVGKTNMSSVDLSWFADGYYSDGEIIKEKKKIIFASDEDVTAFLLRISDYFQGCIYAYLAKKEEISLCQSKNEIECLSDIVFPSNKL